MSPALRFTLESETEKPILFAAKRLILAGWTGRDKAAMEHHIRELEALGITRPPSTPVFYRAATSRLTQNSLLQNPGENSSGEVEYALFNIDGVWWVGVGSDHTDRDVETYNITVSKQMCDKVIAPTLWKYDDLSADWDDLLLRSFATINGERLPYQDARLMAMLRPEELIAQFEAESGSEFAPGDVMMSGTIPAIGGVRPAEQFEFELENEKTGKIIRHSYHVQTLPNVG